MTRIWVVKRAAFRTWLKIFKPHSNNNVRAHSFACRHVNCWNELTETTRNAESLSSFKHLVAKFDFSNI